MSVINQMLKDLEQRAPEQGAVAVPVAISHKPSTIKIILISLAVLVSLNLLGLYIWNSQERVTSNELKVKEQAPESVTNVNQNFSRQPDDTFMLNGEVPEPQRLEQQELILEKSSRIESKVDLPIELSQEPMIEEKAKVGKLVSESKVEKIPPARLEPTKLKHVNSMFNRTKLISPIVVNTPTESKMIVSRRQLTSEELVAQKLVRAEKAIKINDIIKAESLFEEILIIEPNHKQARKKLAALWFGRKSYQQAINLLSQGISLDRSDAELRLLKAKIQLKHGQYNAAYNTLKPLALQKNQEYQVMLANVSQQIEQYKSAIQAYKILIDMQAYSGRWHLGLAIVYDKNSQFSLAVIEYALALTKSDLSVTSAEFAQQRMQALGK